MKSYTDINQSKKLAEMLPIESADGYWFKGFPPQPYMVYTKGTPNPGEHIPCWSLAALRSCLPSGISIDGTLYVFESHNTFDNEWVYGYKYEDNMAIYIKSKNDIDACVEVIIKLHERKLL